MSDSAWIAYEDQEYEWSDALDAFTGNLRPLTHEMKQEYIRRGEEAARRMGWNGEYDPLKFGVLNTTTPSPS